MQQKGMKILLSVKLLWNDTKALWHKIDTWNHMQPCFFKIFVNVNGNKGETKNNKQNTAA